MNHHHTEHATTATCIFTLSVLSEFLSGCTNGETGGTISQLPEGAFVSNLTGQSNTGLWNKKLGLGVRNEADMHIMVNRMVKFEKIRIGDIIVFTQPGTCGLICHPVVAKGNGWVKTKGFYNAECDGWLVTADCYAGKVDYVGVTGLGPWRTVPNLNTSARTTTVLAETPRAASYAVTRARARK